MKTEEKPQMLTAMISSRVWITDKLLLKTFLTLILDTASVSQTNTHEDYKRFKNYVQELVDGKLSARDFLIALKLDVLPDDELKLFEKNLQDLRLSLARNEFKIPEIISPKLYSSNAQYANVNGNGNPTNNHVNEINFDGNGSQIAQASSYTISTRKRSYSSTSPCANLENPDQIQKSQTNGENSTNTLTLYLPAAAQGQDAQPGPSIAKIHQVNSPFNRAKILKSVDQLDNVVSNVIKTQCTQIMDEMTLEHEEVMESQIQENNSLRLKVIEKEQKIDQLEKELEERNQKLTDKEEEMNDIKDELAQTQSDMEDIKSKLAIQLMLNQKNEFKIQEANRRNSVIKDLQKICTTFTTQVENSFTSLIPESIEIDDN